MSMARFRPPDVARRHLVTHRNNRQSSGVPRCFSGLRNLRESISLYRRLPRCGWLLFPSRGSVPAPISGTAASAAAPAEPSPGRSGQERSRRRCRLPHRFGRQRRQSFGGAGSAWALASVETIAVSAPAASAATIGMIDCRIARRLRYSGTASATTAGPSMKWTNCAPEKYWGIIYLTMRRLFWYSGTVKGHGLWRSGHRASTIARASA